MQQEQNQLEVLKLMSLKGWLKSLVELDNYYMLPFNCEFAKYTNGKMRDDINRSILQTLVIVSQITDEKLEHHLSFKKEFITRILEYQSVRSKKVFDIIDELCAIVISNAIGITVAVPQREIKKEKELTPENLNNFINEISKSQYRVELKLEDLMKSEAILKFNMIDLATKDLNKGLEKYKEVNLDLYNEIAAFIAN